MKPRRLDDHLARFDAVARVLAELPAYKQLAQESGYSVNYVSNIMSRLIRLHRAKLVVPHETLRTSLSTDAAFAELLDSAPGRYRDPGQ